MGKVTVFNFITLNGYYKGINEDISWHRHDVEEGAYSEEQLRAGNILLFGRVTYEMMAGYWPTPLALQSFPQVAEGMNKAEKVVFSRTLKKTGWNNTRIEENFTQEVQKMKQGSKDMTVLGSGSIISQLAEEGLIDGYEFMVDPVAIGSGTPIFKNIKHPLHLKLSSTRKFKSGAILLCYEPQR